MIYQKHNPKENDIRIVHSFCVFPYKTNETFINEKGRTRTTVWWDYVTEIDKFSDDYEGGSWHTICSYPHKNIPERYFIRKEGGRNDGDKDKEAVDRWLIKHGEEPMFHSLSRYQRKNRVKKFKNVKNVIAVGEEDDVEIPSSRLSQIHA